MREVHWFPLQSENGWIDDCLMEGWMACLYDKGVSYMEQQELLKLKSSVIQIRPCLYICAFPPKSNQDPFLFWVDVTIHPTFAPAVAGVFIKYICFPFEQLIELSAISGPARPQMAAVKAEMERELSGASHPHRRGTGISTTFDGFKRRCTGGSWRKAQKLLRADRSVRPELSFIPLEMGEIL